ncbi:hypothetical protein ACQP2E_02250 [Actinoplanes sp. CA-015351]|uniref:hypothetical protein n=1 Tax=Actinoplanes sp. CA-015351 TaxID=3239897 RepID=UPI003D958DB0
MPASDPTYTMDLMAAFAAGAALAGILILVVLALSATYAIVRVLLQAARSTMSAIWLTTLLFGIWATIGLINR